MYAGIKASSKSLPSKDPLADRWVNGCAAALTSAVSNGQWPQARLKSAHFTDDSRCQLCLCSAGTLCHRRSCPVTAKARGNLSLPKHLEREYNTLNADQRKLLLSRALLAPVDLSSHPPAAEDSFGWTIMPEGGILMPGWTTYLDGSFRDGPTEDLGRTGWGFISYDPEGKIRAAAFGVPPPWIRSIHGAEMWALFAALRCSLPGGIYRSDRKAVVSTFAAGRAQATSASNEHARLWDMIFTACDDGDLPQLVWMPAHTSAADIGRARLSNGEPLTVRDRAGNDAADILAKRGAETHRVPKEVRKQWKQRDLLATWAARTLAIVTHIANNAQCDSSDKTLRDSAGLPRAARKKTIALALAAAHSSAPPVTEFEVQAAAHSEPNEQPTTDSVTLALNKAASPVEVDSSSEEEVLTLERVGPPPTAQARLQAHKLRQQHREGEHLDSVARAIHRRSHPERRGAVCRATEEIARTLAASAACDRPRVDDTPQPAASSSDLQPASVPTLAPPHSCEHTRHKPARATATSNSCSVSQHSACAPCETPSPDERATSCSSTVTFRPSEHRKQDGVEVSALRLAALLKLCALDDQGITVEWPDGLDYCSTLELLDAHNAIDFDEVEAWKRRDGVDPSPTVPTVAASNSGSERWSAHALAELIELHEDGLPVIWPEGLNIMGAKEQLGRLPASTSTASGAGHAPHSLRE